MKKQDNEQLCALAQKGDTEARDLLLKNNLGFIRKTANEIYLKSHRPASATLRCQDTVGIMPCKLSMLDETVETRLPWLDFSLSRHPCRDISVLHGHNSTLSRHLRYSLSRDCISPTTPTNLTFP